MKLIIYDSIFQLKTSYSEDKKPVLYLKPDTALLRNNNAFFIPDFSSEIQYSIAIILKISKMGKCISPVFAHRYFEEIGIAVNFTASDILKRCILEGNPQEAAYSFDNSSAVSPVFVNKLNLQQNFNFGLKVDNQWIQKSEVSELQTTLDNLLSETSKIITLKIGDYILAGTPCGSGTAKKGERFQGYLQDELLLDFLIQ